MFLLYVCVRSTEVWLLVKRQALIGSIKHKSLTSLTTNLPRTERQLVTGY